MLAHLGMEVMQSLYLCSTRPPPDHVKDLMALSYLIRLFDCFFDFRSQDIYLVQAYQGFEQIYQNLHFLVVRVGRVET